MFRERITGFRNWIKDEVERYGKASRFQQIFGFGDPNGVLTKPGEEIHPLHRGLITAGLPLSSLNKIIEGENLPEEQRRQVREAGWLKSISGTYSLTLLPERGATVAITLDDNEAFNYLIGNADTETMMAFLSYKGKGIHYRYKEAETIETVKNENGTWFIIYGFPTVKEYSTLDTSVHIYTRPLNESKINTKFQILNLFLWEAPKQTT